jgi:methionine aminopeptidase
MSLLYTLLRRYIMHFANDHEQVMVPGMVFTIEPMITEGSAKYTTW